MLNPQLQAEAEELNGRGAPDTRQDRRKRRCRGGMTGHQRPVRRGTSLLRLFGDARQSYSAPESAPAGLLHGECRLYRVMR